MSNWLEPFKSAEKVLTENLRDLYTTDEAQPAQCLQQSAEDARESVARAIWGVLREYEDKCDLELEDLASTHHVWDLAVAAIAAQADKGQTNDQ